MSSLSHSSEHSSGLDITHLVSCIKKSLAGFFRSKQITRTAKIYHSNFEYDLVPNTAINSFVNMTPVTCVDTGDLYICVFEEPFYQGHYQILKPCEKVILGPCGSIVISMNPIPVDNFRKASVAPAWCWEMSVQRYMWHFTSNYRYV